MGEYRRGESRSGTSQLGMLVEQEAGKHIELYVPQCDCVVVTRQSVCPIGRDVGAGGEHLVGRTKQRAACNGWHLHDLRPLSAVNRWFGVGEPAEQLRFYCRGQDQAHRL
jgi:hypothetical protein